MKKRSKIIYFLSATTLIVGILIIIGIFIQAQKIIRFGSVLAMLLVALVELAVLGLLIFVFVKEVSPKQRDSGKIRSLLGEFNALPEEKNQFKNYKNFKTVS